VSDLMSDDRDAALLDKFAALLAERDRLAERCEAAERENREHDQAMTDVNALRDAALAEVAMLREALAAIWQRSGSFSSEVRAWQKTRDALAATADAGKWLEQHDDAVRREEREACAKVADHQRDTYSPGTDGPSEWGDAAKHIAAAIRARAK